LTIDFEEHKRRRSEEDPDKVRCAHCGAWIFARSTRCPQCGVYFRGEAFQFAHGSDELAADRATRRRRAIVMAIGIIIALIISAGLFFSQ